MFEEGVRIDDILNVLKKPTLNDDDNKKEIRRVSDTVIRYDSKASVGEDSIRFEFTRSSGGLL